MTWREASRVHKCEDVFTCQEDKLRGDQSSEAETARGLGGVCRFGGASIGAH